MLHHSAIFHRRKYTPFRDFSQAQSARFRDFCRRKYTLFRDFSRLGTDFGTVPENARQKARNSLSSSCFRRRLIKVLAYEKN